ncbi:TonB-dependent receptor [Novosphingobium rosa]|uniref:TonB-dependent receptor n=1 Tax=Novosphingobium rosa TaxID=76978 RepID=UPI00082D1F99|nr:TonB-dependent receptor [Novosphingobium rosa]
MACCLPLLAGLLCAGRACAEDGAEVRPDIVVTAQHREQKLQDVGIAITALGGPALESMGITSASDLVRAVPTLKQNAYSSAQVVYNIRGVSQNDYGDQQEPPIAVYQDDSYASSINAASFPIFDLQRVEVLRGPQGTLFGRNATGGAIRFVSTQPTDRADGYLTLQTGRYGQILTEGAFSGPITDRLTFRIAGQRERDHGYLKNYYQGYGALGANNHYALRGILAWDAADWLKANLTLRYLRAPRERQGGNYTLTAACPNAQLQGVYLGADETCAYWAGNGLAGPGTTATGHRIDAIEPNFGGAIYNTWRTSGRNYTDRQLFGSTLKLEAALGAFNLTAITDYQASSKRYIEDPYPDPGVLFMQESHLHQGSEEVRLAARLGRHQLMAGAYAMVLDGRYYGQYATVSNDYFPNAYFSQNMRSFAFFAQDEWRLTDTLKLVGGLRYWNDRKRGAYTASEALTGVGLTFDASQIGYSSFGVPQPSDGITLTPADTTQTYRGLTARAQLEYKPNTRMLFYASFNRGSKSGGFTFPISTPLPGDEAASLNGIPYRPETLDAYELGAKLTLPGHSSLNLAAFSYDYRNYQAFAQLGLIQTVLNLPARSKGLEAEFQTDPLRGLHLEASTAFLSTHVSNVTLPDSITVVGHDLPQAPGFSGFALARYTFALGSFKPSLQADVMHSGGFCFTVLCAPVEREDAYTVANLRIGLTLPGDRWDLAAFINNINDAHYRSYALDQSIYDGEVLSVYARPRTWGLRATMRFKP